MHWLYAFLLWLGFAALAIALGNVRVRLAEPLMGEPAAHVVFTLLFCLLLYLLTDWFVGVAGFDTATSQWWLGVIWMALTVCFEFVFGHYVVGHSWQVLLADYNILNGRIWVVVLLTLLLGPRLAG